jgi:hypothetical protein
MIIFLVKAGSEALRRAGNMIAFCVVEETEAGWYHVTVWPYACWQ